METTLDIADNSTAMVTIASTKAVDHPKSPLILVVDDEPLNIKVVCRLLKLEGYCDFISTSDAEDAFDLIAKNRPDLVLLDLMMPHLSGIDILKMVRMQPKLQLIPVVILTAATDRESRVGALEAGATDFITKPIDPSELAPRVRNVLAVKQYHDQLQDYSDYLEEAIRHRTAELEASQQDVIHCLARAAEYRDDDTGQHVRRVGRYARIIGEEMGFNRQAADDLEMAAQLHDVGKIGVPDRVLLKKGKLSEEEFEMMKKHCSYGKHILPQIGPDEEQALRKHVQDGAAILETGSSRLLETAARIALTHHEWWDGSGYPLGLKGEDIPLEGRITAIADVFDALATKRCYKDAFPLDTCFSILEEERGTHFDPVVLDAFLRQRQCIVDTQIQFADEGQA